MKIRIFALAKELGLDSKVLIDLCGQAGIHLKKSALASITPEERDTVVGHINGLDLESAPEDIAIAEEPVSLEPVREVAAPTGNIRNLQALTPRPQLGQADSDVGGSDDSGSVGTAVAEPPADGSRRDSTVGDASDQPEDDSGGAVVAGEGTGREEYSPASGTSGRPVREMKPVGTVQANEARQAKRAAVKARSSLPNIAAPPSYTPPPISIKESGAGPVQKPDMPLTQDILERQSPLADRLRHRKGEGGDHPAGVRHGQSRRRMSLIQQLAEIRAQRKQDRPRRQHRRTASQRRSETVELKSSAQLEFPVTVRGFSEAIGRPARAILQHLFRQGKMLTINDAIGEEAALEISLEFGVDLEIRRGRDIEAELAAELDTPEAEESLVIRPPIVTILGHVDHGKTTLLDTIRKTNVVGGEAGGITQHIAAYQVVHEGHPITFIDTPGHAAFGEMRARGANITDIVVLVVAANDGIMPQTEECISHARSAGVPIVVALNKTDLPDVDEQRVLQGLAGKEVLPSEWGGDTEVIRVSALNGTGIDELLETLLVTAELHEFRANPNCPAVGVCLETFRDEGRGVLAWMILRKGTLRVGDCIVCGEAHGRIRALYNDRDEEVQEAGPSTPVRVAGLDAVPDAGNHFFVMSDIDDAREVVEQRRHEGRSQSLAGRGPPRTLEEILKAARDGAGVQDLPLIIKADTPGSIEALVSEIGKFEHDEVRVQIVHQAVGGVNDSDVYLASASGAIIIAFHVIAEDRAQQLADREGVEIRRYDIIYEVTDHIRQALEGLLRPEEVQVSTGRALVLRTFHISRFGTIAGCRVLNGTIGRENRVHVIRDQKVLNSYRLASLKREKDDVKEVREGMECGIRLDGFNDVKEGDLLEAFRVDKIQRTLDD